MEREKRQCIITGLPTLDNQNIFDNKISSRNFTVEHDHRNIRYYSININGEKILIKVEMHFLEDCLSEEKAFKELEENRELLIGFFLKDPKANLNNKLVYWEKSHYYGPDCLDLKHLSEELKINPKYPKTRKEKYDNLIKYLYDNLPTEESEINISAIIYDHIECFGKLYYKSFDSLKYYLIAAANEDQLIKFNEKTNMIQFTLKGLEYVEKINKSKGWTPLQRFMVLDPKES